MASSALHRGLPQDAVGHTPFSALGQPQFIATGRGFAWLSMEGPVRGHPSNPNEEFLTWSTAMNTHVP